MTTPLRTDVLLTFQVALLDAVRPSLRGVTVGWDERTIRATCIYEGVIGLSEQEECWDLEGEIAAAFPDHEVTVRAVRLDTPSDLSGELLSEWVYCRKE